MHNTLIIASPTPHVLNMSHDGPQHLHPTSPTSSYHLSPAHPTNADTDSERAASPTPSVEPDSPSASTFLRTAATLDGLARQLGDLNHEREASFDDEAAGKCCCGASAGGRGCKTMIERDRMEERMKLGGGELSVSNLAWLVQCLAQTRGQGGPNMLLTPRSAPQQYLKSAC